MNNKETLNFWIEVKNIFEEVSNKFDMEWRKRKRTLGSKLLITIILKLVQTKNKQGYGSTLTQFWEICAEKNIRLPQISSIAPSSLCEARQKLSENVFKQLNNELMNHWQKKGNLPSWKGHRIFAIDGSCVVLPRKLIDAGYKLCDKKNECYYPQGLMSCLYNLQEKVIYNFDFVNHMNERLCILEHIEKLGEKDIVVFDGGYFSYLLLYKLAERGINGIFRLQAGGNNKTLSNFRNSTLDDIIIEYSPSRKVISDLDKRGLSLDIKPIKLRLVKHKISNKTYIYGTTLIGDNYPKDCFAELYHGRWGIEELYKISKQFIDIEDFHSKSSRGVKQELYSHLLLINLARFFGFESNDLLPISKENFNKIDDKILRNNIFNHFTSLNINFKNCLLVVGRHLENLTLATANSLANWVPKIIESIARIRYRVRPNRHYPRVSRRPRDKWTNHRNLGLSTP